MIRIARGPLPKLAVVLAAASVPIWATEVTNRRWDDCRDPERLMDTSEIPGSIPGPPYTEAMLDRVFARSDGELSHHPAGGSKLLYWLVRSDDAFLIHSEPTRPLKLPLDPDRVEVRRERFGDDTVPVHFAQEPVGAYLHIAAYVLVYDGRPIERLLPIQIETSLAQLLHGTRPITLYIVDGIAPKDRPETVTGPATTWLRSAWLRHRAVCGPPG